MEIEDLKTLIAIMNDNNLAEIEIEEEGRKIRLVKMGAGASQVIAVPTAMPQMVPVAAAPAGAGAPGAATPAAAAVNIHVVKAPMVGTFYSAPSPDSDAFVEVGSPVADDTTVCIIEAMKVMNEIHAEIVGTVVEVLVENGHPVEYGQPLFKVQLES